MKIRNIILSASILMLTTNAVAFTTYNTEADNKEIHQNKKSSINQFYTLKQMLDSYKKYHSDFYGENYIFILKSALNIDDFATKEEVEYIKQQNLQTLKRFIERKLGYHVKFKEKIINHNTLIIIEPVGKAKAYNKVGQMIKKLKNIKETALTLPNFNGKKFAQDIDKMIIKLQEYKNLED